MYNAVFRKIVENVRKHRDIKLVTTKPRRNYLVSEPKGSTKVIVIRKDESDEKVLTEFVSSRPRSIAT